MKKTNYLVSLLRKYIYKELSGSERKELTDWANSNTVYKDYLNNLSENIKADYTDYDSLYHEDQTTSKRMLAVIKEKAGVKTRSFKPRHFLVAASVLTAVSVGIYFSLDINDKRNIKSDKVVMSDGSKVILRLSDGSSIDLSESHGGITTKNGEVSYIGTRQSLLHLEQAQSLEIIVPARSQYQVVLADGTKVWLNAGSSFKYPSLFNEDIRKVELSGEAYFEVAKNIDKPFLVISKGQQIKVTGTTFNVSAYPEENMTRTTLIEGEVYVQSSTIKEGGGHQKQIRLSPGEETIYSQREFKKYIADIAMATAWKEGNFYFKDTSFETMIRQIARWYDIDVVYKSKVPAELFTGEMSRKVDIDVVLDFLKGSGIRAELKDKTLFIE